MGMFDYLKVQFPLPESGANDLCYQTKDTPAQRCDRYEFRADGTLWHEAYDTRVEVTDKSLFGFFLHQENKRWEQVHFTGEIRFYTFWNERDQKGWIEWSSYFREGQLQQLNLIRFETGDAP